MNTLQVSGKEITSLLTKSKNIVTSNEIKINSTQPNPFEDSKQQTKSQVLRKSTKKGCWTREEDEKLVEIMKKGLFNWESIAEVIKTRSVKQCKERWFGFLDPSIKSCKWTGEEDYTLFNLYQRFGTQWSTIARWIPGRTANSVKIRCRAILRQLKAGKTLEEVFGDNKNFRKRRVAPDILEKAKLIPLDHQETPLSQENLTSHLNYISPNSNELPRKYAKIDQFSPSTTHISYIPSSSISSNYISQEMLPIMHPRQLIQVQNVPGHVEQTFPYQFNVSGNLFSNFSQGSYVNPSLDSTWNHTPMISPRVLSPPVISSFGGVRNPFLTTTNMQQTYFPSPNQQIIISQPSQSTWGMPIAFSVPSNVNNYLF